MRGSKRVHHGEVGAFSSLTDIRSYSSVVSIAEYGIAMYGSAGSAGRTSVAIPVCVNHHGLHVRYDTKTHLAGSLGVARDDSRCHHSMPCERVT